MTRYSYNHNEVTKEVIQGLLGKYAYIAKVADEKLTHKQAHYDFSLVPHSDGTVWIAINTIHCFNDANDNRVNISVSIVIGKTNKRTNAEKSYYSGKKSSEILGTETIYSDWIVPTEKKLIEIIEHTF